MNPLDGLDQVATARESLARRARAPWWYWALVVAATAAMIGSQVIAVRVSEGWGSLLLYPAAAVMVGIDRVLAHVRGLVLPGSCRSFPSAQGPVVLYLVAFLVAVVAARVTGNLGSTPAELVTVAFGTGLVVLGLALVQRGIRTDLRAGWARP